MSAEAGQVGRVKYSPFDIIASSYRSQNMAVAYFVVSAVFIMPHLAVQVAGAGKLAESLGISYNVGALGIVVVFVFYTTLAGMWGDVWTDAVQAVIMAIGLWVVAGILFWGKWPTIDMGMIVRDITESRGEGWFGLPGPAGFFTHISLMAYVIMFTAVTITQAPYAMRLLVARGPGDIRRAATVLPIILLVFFIPVLLISMYGAATYENLESGDALLGFALGDAFGGIGLVGQILLGLILLALVFAIVSTVDSQLLALGATFASDFYRKMKADVSDKEEVVVGRIVMGVIGIGALIIGLSPPKLIVQLAILSVSGTLQLLPAFLCAVVAPGKVSSISAWASVVTGLAVLLSMEAFGGLGVGRLPSGFVAVVAGSIMMGLCETIVRQARRGA
jgi:SSS family solute:Na+ symporter